MATLKQPPSSKATEDSKPKAETKDSKDNTSKKPINGTAKTANHKIANEDETLDPNVAALMMPSLRRLTKGIPKRELRLMVEEAKTVEEALDREIKQLQQGLDPANYKDNKELETFCNLALDNEVTPADTNFTVSALLGRLRDGLALPLPPNSTVPAHREKVGLLYQPPKKKKKTDSGSASGNGDANRQSLLEKQKQILALKDKPEYANEHPSTTHLLAVLKKISTHRAAIVFRRPVNPKEAPGYTDRILFPMDLSMIRKMIMARMIKSYSELHQRIGLICHNCIKYNGRESDYGVVTREFEAMADDYILSAVETATAVAKAAQAAQAAEQKAPPPTAAGAAAAKKEKAPSRSTSPKPPSRSSSPKPPARGTSPKPPPRGKSPKPPSRSSSPKPPSRSSSPTPQSMAATKGAASVKPPPRNSSPTPVSTATKTTASAKPPPVSMTTKAATRAATTKPVAAPVPKKAPARAAKTEKTKDAPTKPAASAPKETPTTKAAKTEKSAKDAPAKAAKAEKAKDAGKGKGNNKKA